MNAPVANRHRVARGFTLIELLVAVAITAILTTMGYLALNQALEGRRSVERGNARLLKVQFAVQQIEQDLELLQPRPVRDASGNGWDGVLVSGSGAGGNLGSGLSQQAGALLQLTRGGWSNPAGLPRTELQRVSYVLADGTLWRQHLPVLDAAGDLALVRRELLTDVEAVSFRFMDDGYHWTDSWPPISTGTTLPLRLRPVAVELTLKLKDMGTITRVIEVL